MIIENMIKLEQDDRPNDLVMRKTKLIVFGIIAAFSISTTIILWILVSFVLYRDAQDYYWAFMDFLENAFGTVILLFILLLRIASIKRLIWYFYYVVIIAGDRVVKISFDLFFREEVKIVELSSILSVTAKQDGILQSLFSFWDVIMKLQNSWNMVIKSMPSPKKIIRRIEELKEHINLNEVSSQDL